MNMARLIMSNHSDVFVSFRGDKETSHSFTDHLFDALQRKGIVAFRDDAEINKSESIASDAIKDSQVYIVVLSKNYASSTWCLQELEYILQYSQQYGKRVLPVFFDVDPSEVRNQSGSYQKAFAEHEKVFGHKSEKVRLWRDALTQVASFSGWGIRDKPKSISAEIIEEITGILDLGRKISNVPNDLVGMDFLMEELEKFLLLDSFDDVRAVGIWGMGGAGKTTLAAALYRKICHLFDAYCFIDAKVYEQEGPIGAQKQILDQTLDKEYNQLYNISDRANLIQSRPSHGRVLIIFDNVDHREQLEKLALNRKSLAAGSRIVIVCRDNRILKEYGVHAFYKVPLLNERYSHQLFCKKAFKSDNIKSKTYEELAHDVLRYANGLPLAIDVLGSSLSGRSISEWRDMVDKLGEIPNKHIKDTLQFSFDELLEPEREIFLDIACFFNGRDVDYVRNILDCCGFHPENGLRVLVDKSLISISNESKIEMHGLLEVLGKNIVRDNSRKSSRLWLHKQLFDVVYNNMEKNVEAVVLSGPGREKGMPIAEALSKMNHLRLLILKEVKFSGSINYLSNKLTYVEWDEYPFLYLPSNFQPNQLCELILVDSCIKQLWEEKKFLPSLRTLDLSCSENLTMMPHFGEFPVLKRLNLEGCVKLVQIDSSIGSLKKLVFLNLKNCENLICIPKEISGLTSLEYFNFGGCSKALNNPKAHESFSSYLLPSLASVSCLSELDISFCSVSQIPDTIGCLALLERLNLRGNNFIKLPSLQKLSKLEYLNLEHCKQLTSLPELPSPAAIKQDKHKRAGMFIFNCPELGGREQCSNMTLSWMMHFIQANQYSSASFHQIDIVIPGSEIPRWFNNRRMGRSISIDPSPIVYDNNIIGIACCASFSVEPFDPTKTAYEWGPVIRLGFKGGIAANSDYVVIPVTLYRHLITVKSNHMWLIYFGRELFFSFLSSKDNTLWELDHIKMEASVTNGQGLDMEVKNSGYRWVFKTGLTASQIT